MATNKRITDLTDYTSVLPYASEMFGVYQPLLGWRSKRIEERFDEGFQGDKTQILDLLRKEFVGLVDIQYKDDATVNIQINPGTLQTRKFLGFDSIVLDQISMKLPAEGVTKSSIWHDAITRDTIGNILNGEVVKNYTGAYADLMRSTAGATGFVDSKEVIAAAATNTSVISQRTKVAAFER
jgi:hypothetical protein